MTHSLITIHSLTLCVSISSSSCSSSRRTWNTVLFTFFVFRYTLIDTLSLMYQRVFTRFICIGKWFIWWKDTLIERPPHHIHFLDLSFNTCARELVARNTRSFEWPVDTGTTFTFTNTLTHTIQCLCAWEWVSRVFDVNGFSAHCYSLCTRCLLLFSLASSSSCCFFAVDVDLLCSFFHSIMNTKIFSNI